MSLGAFEGNRLTALIQIGYSLAKVLLLQVILDALSRPALRQEGSMAACVAVLLSAGCSAAGGWLGRWVCHELGSSGCMCSGVRDAERECQGWGAVDAVLCACACKYVHESTSIILIASKWAVLS